MLPKQVALALGMETDRISEELELTWYLDATIVLGAGLRNDQNHLSTYWILLLKRIRRKKTVVNEQRTG